VVGNFYRDRAAAAQQVDANRTSSSWTIDYALRQTTVSLLSAWTSAVVIAGAMPFGNHHHNAQNDPAQGIFAAASALGSM
jgi:hypothetical protein